MAQVAQDLGFAPEGFEELASFLALANMIFFGLCGGWAGSVGF